MEEDSNDSRELIFIPQSNIRAIESNIQAQLDSFEKEGSDTTFLETTNVCDNVRDKILFYEDEPHLSKTQNNLRRIFIASELFISICSIYGHIVDNEFSKIVNDMVQWKKYKTLSKRIMHKVQLEIKKEKYFAKEADSKLLKSLEAAESQNLEEIEREERNLRDVEQEPRLREVVEQVPTSIELTEQISVPLKDGETATALTTISERGSHLVELESLETFEQAIPGYDVNETLAIPLESTSRDDILSSFSANMSEMRAEPPADNSRLQYPISIVPRQELSLPGTLAETSIREPVVQEKTDDDFNRILQILEDQIFQQEVGDIVQPIESTERSTDIPKDSTVEEFQTDLEKRVDASEESEEWSLPSLEHLSLEKTRKRNRLIIDKITIIPEYAERALQLNRNINIQRVQVFEGPPNIIQGISANHLMRTPGFKSSLFQDVRSSRLSALYSRHLEVEKKPAESVLQRRIAQKKKEDEVLKARTNLEVTEEIKERPGMRSLFEKSDILAELPPDKSHIEEIGITAAAVPPKESLIGVPVSRIVSSTIQPPEEDQMERINAAPILPTPRAQQLQGKSLDPVTTSSWFLSSKQNPPSEKFREFNYVYKKLQEYWSLFEMQGMEKCITLREFFSFEEGASVANYLTTLRIVDKMSIQRKIFLEYKDNDILIKPFESPYVSDGQLLLKGKEPLLWASF